MKYKIMSLLLCLCFLTGCTNQIASSDPTESESSCTELNPQQLYTALFDIENKISLRLEMSDEELQKMQTDYNRYDRYGSKSPIYRKGDLHVTITTPSGQNYSYSIEEVGVRMKGNTSRTDFYSEEEGIYNLIHLKISFQETFDNPDYYGDNAKQWEEEERKARKDRTFATLEKLDLRWNRCDDSTYLKEYFAYETYRQYGVAAPHTNLCSFDWAGIHMGVFTLYEPVDKLFLSKSLPENALGGDLYKLGWAGGDNGSFTGLYSVGIEDEDRHLFYAYDLKTNKNTSQHEALTNLIKTLNRGVTKEEFSELVDMDSFLQFCAVSYLLGNPDDLRNNYNNCYIYFRSDNGKAILIPYDYDRCLGITAHWNPTGDGVTSDNPFSLYINSDNSYQRSPLFLQSVAAGGHFTSEYAAALEEITSGTWFRFETFAAIYAKAEANYAELSRPGKVFHNTKWLYLSFDLERSSAFSSQSNISIRKYLDAKLQSLKYYLSHADIYAAKQPDTKPEWYIRCDATNWQSHSDYAMISENNLVTLQFHANSQIRLKVYHEATDRWYGAECVAENCPVPFTSDGYTNIVLSAGTYRITFDPLSLQITIEKE